MVQVTRGVSLKPFNTFGVDVRAAFFATASTVDELSELLGSPEHSGLPWLVLGGGSNLLFTRDFEGLVIKLAIRGIERRDEADGFHRVRVGAGENWHATVVQFLDDGLAGLENLALIPGEVGAAPIQNIGAYGVELAERVDSVEVWDVKTNAIEVLDAAACHFSYRDSVFKRHPGTRVITGVNFALPVEIECVTGYADVASELRMQAIERPTPRDVFNAVVAIRRRKLPDPAVIGNAGSFFKNPIVGRDERNALIERFPSLVSYDIGGGRCKLAAGWMIDACGLKGYSRGRAAVYERQALVLVNRGGATGAEIRDLALEVQERVFERFGVRLEPEPTML